MKKSLSFTAILMVSLLFTSAGNYENDVLDTKEASASVTEYQLHGRIRSIDVQGPHVVEYVQSKGDAATVSYSVPPGYEQYADVRISGGKLVIKWKDGISDQDLGITATVSSPTLDAVTVTGSGEVVVKGKLTTTGLKANLSGDGLFRANALKCEFLETTVSGPALVDISGLRSDIVRAKVEGGGYTYFSGRTRMGNFNINGEQGEILYSGLKVRTLDYKRHRNK